MIIFKKIEVIGNGKELQINGWDKAPEDIKKGIKVKLVAQTAGMVFGKLLAEESSVNLERLNEKYTLTATWISTPFGDFRERLSIEASVNDMEYMRHYLCGCEKCTSRLVELLGEEL